MNWNHLESLESLEDIDKASVESPVVIFKHSTRCSISSMALSRFERSWNEAEMEKINIYYLDLIAFREVSDQVAERYDVYHQSPQLIVVKEGKCIYNDSHTGISYETLKTELAKV